MNGRHLYNGIVEGIMDPLQQGRVQVRVFGVHTEDKSLIPTHKLPWSTIMGPTTSPGISGLGHSSWLLRGASVIGFFEDELLQDFVVMGSRPTQSGSEARLPSRGFGDPEGTYPIHQSEEDNNIRTRGGFDPDVEFKLDGGKYQPYSSYAPEYPYNHVYETESGHLKEYDDTFGAERIREKHMSGTYYEIQPNGSKIERIHRDNYQLVIGDDTVEVFGSVNIVCSQNVNLVAGGSLDAMVSGEIIVRGEMNCNINIDGKINIDALDSIKIYSALNTSIIAEEDVSVLAKKHVSIMAEEDIDILAEGIINMTAKDDINITSDKNINIKSGADGDIFSKIHLNE
jgi:hypothetical protein